MKVNKVNIAPYLINALERIANEEGENLKFVFHDMNISTARSYISKLKKLGLAYIHIYNGVSEVWAHPRGRKFIADLRKSES